jgi:hypothetical protein
MNTTKTNSRQKKQKDASERGIIPRIKSGGVANVFGFPPRILTKLRYVDTYSLTSTAGSLAKQLFTVNSMYDPDVTGTGHQPLYYDTFASIYDHYAVVSAHIKITFNSNATTSSVIVGGVYDDDTFTSTNVNVLMEQTTGKHLFLPNNAGSLSSKTITLDWNCEKMLGIDPYTSQSYKTAVGSNPSEQSTLLVWAVPADLSSTTTTSVMVEIEFQTLFSELSTQSIS